MMTSRERVLCALAGGQPDRVPFAEHQIDPPVLTTMFGERLARDPVYVAEQLGLDILTFTLVPPLFVHEETLPDGRVHQTGGKLHTREDLALLDQLRDPTDPALYASLEELAGQRGNRALIGKTRLGISATLMSMDLVGFSNALADDPELISLVLRRYVQWGRVAAEQMRRRGVDALWCFDDIAFRSGPMMSPSVFRELIVPPVAELTRELTVPWIYHSDGNLELLLPDLLALGMNGLHPIEPESMSLRELKQAIGRRVCLIGNVSVDVLARGTPEQTAHEVRRCFRDGAPGGAFMISSSNSIPGYAKPENVWAMVEAIRKEWAAS